MSSIKVSALTAKTSPSGSEELLINDSGVSKKITIGNAFTDTNTTYTSSDFTHDSLSGVTANEHIDWTGASAGTIHSSNYTDTNTTYSVQDGELSENNFTDADHTKLNGIEASADVTDATNVTAAGALMDSEVTNLADVKAFDTTDYATAGHNHSGTYATAAQGTTADAALPKAGGAMTGAITTNSTFDGVDIATRDGVLTTTTTTANAALPKAGGTMTGSLDFGDNVKATFGDSDDLQIYHDGSHSRIYDTGTGNLTLMSNGASVKIQKDATEVLAAFNNDGSVQLYHNNAEKLATTSTGIDVTGRAVVDSANCVTVIDNDGSFDMDGGNNFKCTPSGNFTLTFTNITDGQSGFILLVNSGGHTVSAASTSKVDANLLATVSTAGTYLLGYFSDGTNAYLTNSAIYA